MTKVVNLDEAPFKKVLVYPIFLVAQFLSELGTPKLSRLPTGSFYVYVDCAQIEIRSAFVNTTPLFRYPLNLVIMNIINHRDLRWQTVRMFGISTLEITYVNGKRTIHLYTGVLINPSLVTDTWITKQNSRVLII